MSFKSFLNKDFEITDLDSLSHMLGVLVTRDWQNHLIYLNQTTYIQWTIIWFGMQDAAPVSTSLVERVQKGIAYWNKQNNDVPAPNCVLKVWGEIIKVEGL